MNLLSDKHKNLYEKATVIGIDEAQFFPDLRTFVLRAEVDHKILILAGLDGDSERRPFGQILDCIPLCDTVTKLTAMDMVDKDGTPALLPNVWSQLKAKFVLETAINMCLCREKITFTRSSCECWSIRRIVH